MSERLLPRVLRALATLSLSLLGLMVALILSEIGARWLDGQQLLALRLKPSRLVIPPPKHLDPTVGGGPLGDDVDPTWITTPPPPPAIKRIDPAIAALSSVARARGLAGFEVFREWNRKFITELACTDNSLQRLPQPFMVFEPVEPTMSPPFRYLPSRRMSGGLVTNRFGWRGPDIPLDKPAGTIRLAFVGASTTVGLFNLPFSYPEYVVHWLNLYAERNKLGVRFDGINAGREGLGPANIAAVIRQELVPMEPDLVIYYEGANRAICARNPHPPLPEPSASRAFAGRVVDATRDYSALARRFEAVLMRFDMHDGAEPPKPRIDIDWPVGIDEAKPDLGNRALPAHLKEKVEVLDSGRAALAAIGAELAPATFVYIPYEGLRLDPYRHNVIYRALNEHCWPYRYADIRRDVDLDNSVMRRYAELHGEELIDVAGSFPLDPDLFFDSVHLNGDGNRMQAWIVFRALIPIVKARLQSGAWPRPDRTPLTEHPGLRPAHPFRFTCKDGRMVPQTTQPLASTDPSKPHS